jgi:hypothetical protein
MASWDDRQRPKPGPDRDKAILEALGLPATGPSGAPPYSTNEAACNALVETIERTLGVRLRAELVEGRVWTAAFVRADRADPGGPLSRVPGKSRVDAVSAAAWLALQDSKATNN